MTSINPTLVWFGRCGNATCLELARDDDSYLIRSASTLPGEEVRASRDELRLFLINARNGAFDHLVEEPA